MEGMINPRALDPVRMQTSLVDALEESVQRRLSSVQNGEDFMKVEGYAAIDMPHGAALFLTTGPWEDYSTPSRDMRLLISIDAVVTFPERVAAHPERFGIPGVDRHTTVEQVRAALQAELEKRTFEYLRSDGTTWKLTLADLVARNKAMEVAYNPNDCVEIRWGAPEGSEETGGELVAFLSYLVQILMSVMMATFVAVMAPAASVCAERISEVLDTPQLDRRRSGRRSPSWRATDVWSFDDVGLLLPGAEAPVLTDISFVARAGRDHRDHRQHRFGQDHAVQPRATALRRDRRCGDPRRRRRPRPRARGAVVPHRSGPPEAVPLLRARWRRTCATRDPTPPTRSCGRRCGSRRPRTSCEAMPEQARHADRAGRHQRLGWPAATSGDRPGAGAPTRRSSCSTTRSRRST